MLEVIWISLNITIIQLFGAYFRYLPFRSRMSEAEIYNFWLRISIWSVMSFIIIAGIIFSHNLTVPLYKVILMAGWLPYAIISMLLIKEKFSIHLFVIGVQSVWSLMLHTVVAICLKFCQIEVHSEIIFFDGIWYMSLLLILIKWEMDIFSNILRFSKEIFDSPLGKYFSIMPIAVLTGCLITISGSDTFLTYKEQFLRFLIPLFFFFMYRAVKISHKQFEELRHNSYVEEILNHQLETLKLYDTIMQENQKQILEFRRNLRQNYKLISEMLSLGKIGNALEFIKAQDKFLQSSQIKSFCAIPLLNAVFLIYKQKAEEFKITVRQKIILAEEIPAEEMDFAVLLSNLLEQSFNSLKLQPEKLRDMAIKIHCMDNQMTLEFSFQAAEQPLQDKAVLKSFVEKYDAKLEILYEENFFRLFISWSAKT